MLCLETSGIAHRRDGTVINLVSIYRKTEEFGR